MKKSVLIALFLILLIVPFASAGIFEWFTGDAVSECVDSDGINYYTKDEAKQSSDRLADYCIDKRYLAEALCRNGALSSEKYLCPAGCADGACLPKSGTETIPTICKEGSLQCSKDVTSVQVCSNGNWVTRKKCEYGCDNGVCISEPTTETECEENGGICIYFQDKCKEGYISSSFACTSRSEKCCILKEGEEQPPEETEGITSEVVEQRLADLNAYYVTNPFTLHSTPTEGVFDVLVIIDTDSYAVDRNKLEKILMYADKMLYDITGIHTHYLDILEIKGSDISISVNASREAGVIITEYIPWDDIILEYIDKEKKYPNGVIIFYKYLSSFTYGGYSYMTGPINSYCNEFMNPLNFTDRIYGGIIDWEHRFAICGYERDFANLTLNHISNFSLPNECGYIPTSEADISRISGGNIPKNCVYYEDYYICENSLNDEFPLTKVKINSAYFLAMMIIHEYMHDFGVLGNMDHSSTPDCTATMKEHPEYLLQGFKDQNNIYGFYDPLAICPHIYYNFKNGLIDCSMVSVGEVEPVKEVREPLEKIHEEVFDQPPMEKPKCDGCLSEGKCLPYGTRTKGLFCSLDGNMENQKTENQQCENNFECDSNLCISNKCVSESIWNKFVKWFSRFFSR